MGAGVVRARMHSDVVTRVLRALELALGLGCIAAAIWWLLPRDSGGAVSLEMPPREERPVVLTSPLANTVERVPGCSRDGDDGPLGHGRAELINPVSQELLDRAQGLYRDHPALRRALREALRKEGDHEAAIDALRDHPERVQDGFDLAVAVAVTAAQWELADHAEGALRWARVLDELAPGSPHGPVLRSLVAEARGDAEVACSELGEAFSREPEEPAITLPLVSCRKRRGDGIGALVALEAYREAVPGDVWADALHLRLQARVEVERSLEETTREGVTLVHALPEALAAEVHADVIDGLVAAAEVLHQARRRTLRVVVYPDREAFDAAVCGPQWSGGVFDGAIHLPPRTVRSPARRRSLRHEAMHAQLAPLSARTPVWLDEGLAQLNEGAPAPGLARSLELLRRERTYIPFPSIEGSFLVIDDADAARLAYHQSYAMVAALLAYDPRSLGRALAHFEGGGDGETVLEVASDPPLDGEALLRWLDERGE